MSGYTHCRGCGKLLYSVGDRIDGLCALRIGLTLSCFEVAREWTERRCLPVDFSQHYTEPAVASAPVWQVAIDEWLSSR